MHISAGKVVTIIQYRILTTGSHGNSVMIDDILIDAGLTRRKLESIVDISDIHHVFIIQIGRAHV